MPTDHPEEATDSLVDNESTKDQENRSRTTTGSGGEYSDFGRRDLLKVGGLAALGLPLFTKPANAHHNDASDLILRSKRDNTPTIHLDAGSNRQISGSRIYLNGVYGNLRLGGSGHDGDLVLKDEGDAARIHLDTLGNNENRANRVYIDGQRGDIWLEAVGGWLSDEID